MVEENIICIAENLQKDATVRIKEILANGIHFDENLDYGDGEYVGQLVVFVADDMPVTGSVYNKYPCGSLHSCYDYNEGVKNGEYAAFYKEGVLKSYGTMSKGVKHGTIFQWHENGSIQSVSECKYGYKTSESVWDENGTLIKQLTEPTALSKTMIEKYEQTEKSKE